MSEMSRVLGVPSRAVLAAAALAALLWAAPAQADSYHVAVRGAAPGPRGSVGGGGRAYGGSPGVRVYSPGVRVNPGVRGGYSVRPGYGGRPGYGYPGVRVRRPVVGVPRHGYRGGYYYQSRPYWYPDYWGFYWGGPWGYGASPYGYGYYDNYAAPCCYASPQAYGSGPPPGTYITGGRRREEPSIGVGIRGTELRAGEDRPTAQGVGPVLRFRSRPVELELEVGWDHYNQNTQRDDTRVAASLYVPLVGTVIQPFLVGSAGMSFAHFDVTGDTLHQGYLAGGGGLALNLGRQLTISVDARYMVREFFDNDASIARNPTSLLPGVVEKHDDAVEFRGNVILYF